MIIRVMTIDDYEGVFKLWNGTPGVGLNPYEDCREGVGRYLERNPDTSFIAEEDGEIVGAVLAGHDGRRGFIYHMTVSERFRRNGIGTALVEAVRAVLLSKGIYKASLVAKANNEGGNRFWASQGFITREDLTYRNTFIMDEIK